MALNKTKTVARPDTTTASGNYWKISKIEINKSNMEVKWTISLYVSKAAATANAACMGPNHSLKVVLSKEELAGDLTALGYAKIKAKIAGAEPTSPFPADGFSKVAWNDLHNATDV